MSEKVLDEKLVVVRDDDFENVSDFDDEFKRIADVVLNQTELIVCGKERFKIVEIEFYYKSDKHPDIFAHCDAAQQNNCCWYFHRQGGKSYKSGTYKGLDLAIGKSNVFGGILIRSIMRLSDSKLFEGPCLSVNAILAVAGLKEVAPFADDLMGGDLQANSSDVKHPLRLVAAKDREERVDRCARVGLTLKKKDSPALRQQFIGAPYRFLTNNNLIRKGVAGMAASLAHQGLSPAEICSTMALRPNSINKYVAAFEKGKKRDIESFVGIAIPTGLVAELYGSWVSAFKQ